MKDFFLLFLSSERKIAVIQCVSSTFRNIILSLNLIVSQRSQSYVSSLHSCFSYLGQTSYLALIVEEYKELAFTQDCKFKSFSAFSHVLQDSESREVSL